MAENSDEEATLNYEYLDEQLQEIRTQVETVAAKCEGDSRDLLSLLRTLEALHREIRTDKFEPSLPNTRNALYQLLKDIDENGGWPYIERMKIQAFVSHFFPELNDVGESELKNPLD